jgi:hypothetical protein
VQQDDAISEFIQTIVIGLGMQILKHMMVSVCVECMVCDFKSRSRGFFYVRIWMDLPLGMPS